MPGQDGTNRLRSQVVNLRLLTLKSQLPLEESKIFFRRVGKEFAVGGKVESYDDVFAIDHIRRESLQSRLHLHSHIVIRHRLPHLNEIDDLGFGGSNRNLCFDCFIQFDRTKYVMLAQNDEDNSAATVTINLQRSQLFMRESPRQYSDPVPRQLYQSTSRRREPKMYPRFVRAKSYPVKLTARRRTKIYSH